MAEVFSIFLRESCLIHSSMIERGEGPGKERDDACWSAVHSRYSGSDHFTRRPAAGDAFLSTVVSGRAVVWTHRTHSAALRSCLVPVSGLPRLTAPAIASDSHRWNAAGHWRHVPSPS